MYFFKCMPFYPICCFFWGGLRFSPNFFPSETHCQLLTYPTASIIVFNIQSVRWVLQILTKLLSTVIYQLYYSSERPGRLDKIQITECYPTNFWFSMSPDEGIYNSKRFPRNADNVACVEATLRKPLSLHMLLNPLKDDCQVIWVRQSSMSWPWYLYPIVYVLTMILVLPTCASWMGSTPPTSFCYYMALVLTCSTVTICDNLKCIWEDDLKHSDWFS